MFLLENKVEVYIDRRNIRETFITERLGPKVSKIEIFRFSQTCHSIAIELTFAPPQINKKQYQ